MRGLRRIVLALIACCVVALGCRAQDVLIVADEFHAMQMLASHLEADTKVHTRNIGQLAMPASLASYRAVRVYLHGELQVPAEHKFIEYAKGGGTLILLHHTITSRKRENKNWFNFLHIELPAPPFADCGYMHFDPVTFQAVNLAAGNPGATKGVTYDQKTAFSAEVESGKTLLATSFPDTEVYVNHVLSGSRTLLAPAGTESCDRQSDVGGRDAGGEAALRLHGLAAGCERYGHCGRLRRGLGDARLYRLLRHGYR